MDAAIAKGRAFLAKTCREGNLAALQETPATVRAQAESCRTQAGFLRKQAEGLTHAGGGARKEVQELLKQAKDQEAQAADLEKKAARMKEPSAPAPKPSGPGPAPAADFVLGHGEVALAGLALVQTGLKPSDPLLEGIWRALRDAKPKDIAGSETYTLALSMMFVDGMMHAKEPWPVPERKKEVSDWIQKTAGTLAGGCDGGAWTYGRDYTVAGAPGGYTVSGGDPIGSEALKKAAVPGKDYDYSNTQYALMGLKAAALCGAKVDEGVWRLVLQRFLLGQEPKGKARGWGYGKGEVSPRPTMTAAGLAALLVSRSESRLTPPERAVVEEGIRDGLAWFQEHWPPFTPGNGYLLYGLERLGVLGNLPKLGEHDWYAEGSRFLLGTQSADGSWGQGLGSTETSFALLFLCRGTRAAYAKGSYEVTESP